MFKFGAMTFDCPKHRYAMFLFMVCCLLTTNTSRQIKSMDSGQYDFYIISRVESGNPGHQVNSDSGLVRFMF